MLTLGHFDNRAYIITCKKTNQSVLIDAPAGADQILKCLADSDLKYILMTHNHSDHIEALSKVKSKLGAPIAAHKLNANSLPVATDILLNDGDLVVFGDNVELRVLHTPGHTPGSLCFLLNDFLFSGDTIFPDGPGHTRNPSNLKQIIESITSKILVLNDETQIYPGHGTSAILRNEKQKYGVFANKTHSPNLCGDVLWLSS
jgi:glyoxylase-like metal-dependent hydrolase (beta-lactamase superfamily II)